MKTQQWLDVHEKKHQIITSALYEIEHTRQHSTDGRWLEDMTVRCAPIIADWDISKSWHWKDWPDRGNTADIGIDVVAERKSDGKLIAIQCKSRRLNEKGRGNAITKADFNSFLATSSDEIWAERWLVVIGNTPLAPNAEKAIGQKLVTRVNIESDLLRQRSVHNLDTSGPRINDEGLQTLDDMQKEAIDKCITLLQEHTQANANNRARGRLILPCGTGKSRIALRIIEKLTEPGQVSAVLCPSIALVSQLRSEFLAHCHVPLHALAVCSDESVAKDKQLANDPTADSGYASASEVKGHVTTKADEIGRWFDGVVTHGKKRGVIFGTYQSSHRIAEALESNNRILQVVIADEAHRTAGLRRLPTTFKKIKDFTICHDDQKFPAKFRIYQTATPRVYSSGERNSSAKKSDNWVVRDMDDESVFGPELYRRSYADAVDNNWLTNYRIIGIGVNDEDAFETANQLATKSGKKLSTAHFLKGLALALIMAGALRSKGVEVRSSINFMNLIARSKEMTSSLESQPVRDWVQRKLRDEGVDHNVAAYSLEHLDASSKATERENAIARLLGATEEHPHGVLNVGIFGEGVDAPLLSAVGFLEARKSPVDVIQAVGRVMRRAENKKLGYIICPILIPQNTDAEKWLRDSGGPEDGWQELGQILLALRAHDSRIEDELADLMCIYLPSSPREDVDIWITLGRGDGRVWHGIYTGKLKSAVPIIEKTLKGELKSHEALKPVSKLDQDPAVHLEHMISGHVREDGEMEIREATIVRKKQSSDGTRGEIDIKKTKAKGRKMVNGEMGRKRPRQTRSTRATAEERVRGLFDEIEHLDITANLLEKSGLARNRRERDVNIIEDSINEATRCLRMDELTSTLDKHFGIDKITREAQKKQADGCTIAALLLMNAAMLHQRIAAGKWLSGISGMDVIKNTPNVTRMVYREWNKITRHDFLPVLEPAIEVIDSIQATGRESGLNRALHHLAGEAERIAENYADLGADHAGPLFNRVMGNQASDGAYFTRPPAATLLAALTLDVTSQGMDWSQDDTWRAHRAVDLACGSGTLIAALLTDMKRRASDNGAKKTRLAELQKLAVEDVIAGLDFNPVSLQLAAAQLTAGNRDVAYRKMQLYRMPYGPDETKGVRCGTPELLGQQKILHDSGLGFYGEEIGEEQLQLAEDDPTLSDAVDAVKNVRIVVMNPPFTNRAKMGKKFSKAVQQEMRQRVDAYENKLVTADPDMAGFVDKNSIAPLFVALAERCLDPNEGVISMINPTIALTAISGRHERILLAERFHIHTLLTCHRPGEVNLSQNTAINESVIIARRCDGIKPPTRIISLDRFPKNEGEALELHKCLMNCAKGTMPDGWGEVSEWSTNRIEKGDWSAAAFRSPVLAEAAARIGMDANLLAIIDQGIEPSAVLQGGAQMRALKKTDAESLGSFPVLYSKSAAAQKCIDAKPDQYLVSTKPLSSQEFVDHQMNAHTENLLHKAGHLLVTAGQDTSTGRLTAVASERKYIGVAWMPVPSLSYRQAKAMAVFLNSTAGRIQLMRNPGKKLAFPAYSPGAYFQIRTPDLRDNDAISILSQCWEATKTMEVPQYRDGECEIRRLWDEAVAEAIGWDADELAEWRKLLHEEPHVRGLGRQEYDDEVEEK